MVTHAIENTSTFVFLHLEALCYDDFDGASEAGMVEKRTRPIR
jgi:hypothetical protein